MGIVVKQFDGSSVTPKDDAVVNELIFQSYGIFNGCGISFLGVNKLMVNSGRMIIKGRQVVITEETIAAQLSSSGTKKGRLYIRMDLSSPDTPAAFLTQVADKLPELTQQNDVNYNDGIFEVELCNYDVSEVAISNIVETCPVITGSVDMISTMEELMANTEFGKSVDALLVKQVTNSLTNEDNETFNFGVKDGVRGFYTNPSRADDSFIPFSRELNDMNLIQSFADSKTITFTAKVGYSYIIFGNTISEALSITNLTGCVSVGQKAVTENHSGWRSSTIVAVITATEEEVSVTFNLSIKNIRLYEMSHVLSDMTLLGDYSKASVTIDTDSEHLYLIVGSTMSSKLAILNVNNGIALAENSITHDAGNENVKVFL